MRNSALVLAAFALASAGVAPVVSAQTLRGQVIDSVLQAPVGAGFVVLVGPDGQEVTRTLTTRDGRFTIHLQPGQLGPLRVRSERIGYRVSVTDWFHVSSEDTKDLIIWVSPLPTPLSTIEIRESTECKVRPTEDEQTAVVWEEVRKALAAASWTASQQLYHVVSNLYDRDMDGRRRRVRQEHHRPSIGLSSKPFMSRAPIELLQNGYVSDEDGVVVYYAPDAEVLQDDGFLGTHCFRLRHGDDEGPATLIGLGFEPVPSRKLPDVEGVLWLDRQSSELRSLEFRYVNLPRHLRVDGPSGGMVEFMPLPSGAWIVHRWSIGIPTAFREVRVNPFVLRRRADAFRYTGGEVLTITDRTGALVYEAELAELVGVVVDSTDGRQTPLAGATVRVEGTWFTGTTNRQGLFRLGAPLDGEFNITFSHPRADFLAFTPPVSTVTLARGRRDTLWLAIPPIRDVIATLCPDFSQGAYMRVLVGTVRDSATGTLAQDVDVVATWQHISPNLDFLNMEGVAKTDTSGTFVLCGLEHTRPAIVYALGSGVRSELVRVSFEGTGVEVDEEYYKTYETAAGIWRRDLTLDPQAERTTVLAGIVSDAATGTPLASALVTVDASGLSATTDTTGMFRLRGVPSGTQRVTVRRPGYALRWGDVEVHDDKPTIIGAASLMLTPVPQVVGAVTEPETGSLVSDVWLTLISAEGDSVTMTRSDDSGAFVLTAPEPGPYYVAARRIGYTPDIMGPFQLRTGRAVEVEFPISPSAFGLEPFAVTGQAPVPSLVAVGFYQRQRQGKGVFLDRKAIEQRAAAELGDLLRAIPGITVDYNGLIRLRGIRTGVAGTCGAPLVYVDGIAVNRDEVAGGVANASQWHRSVDPTDIEAIEVYRSPAEIPAQYNTGGQAACGVILIWTRGGGY